MKLYILLVILFLSSCANLSLPGDFDRSGKEIRIITYFYEDVYSMTKTFKKRHKGLHTSRSVLGYATWNLEEPYTCEIHSVRPRGKNSDAFNTLGHELLHCLTGNWH